MKNGWRPTLTTKEALAICGSLSNPSKMPGHGYALPAQRCRLGSLLQLIPKTVCHYCYALRGRYLFPAVQAAMEKRFSSLSDPRWVEAVSTLIYRSGDWHFRWHDSGDLRDLKHLRKIVRVCLNLPQVRFWLPTREYQTVEAYRRMGGPIPANLCIRYSAHLVDGFPPVRYGLPAGGVHSRKSSIPEAAHICPAPKQNMKCGNCRSCWDPSVKIVSYHLKYGLSDGQRKMRSEGNADKEVNDGKR
jgi:Gene product 88